MDAKTLMMWDGQGPVSIGTFDLEKGRPESGYLVDVYRIGCGTSQLSTTLSVEKRVVTETCSGQRLPLAERETGKTLEVTLAMVQFSGRTLAAALYGEAVTQASGTVTEETLPLLAPGDYFRLRHPKASSVVITDSTAGTPLTSVLGTHYELDDGAAGRFRLIAHPASHVEPAKADYSYGEYLTLAAFTTGQKERGIIFDGINSDGQRARLILPRVSLAPSGDFAWISDEEATLTLSGQALYVPELSNDPDYGPFMRVSFY